MFTLRLTTEEAILLRNALMLLLQQSVLESRPEIQKVLDSVNLYLAISLRNE
jgi:hypothetical protein